MATCRSMCATPKFAPQSRAVASPRRADVQRRVRWVNRRRSLAGPADVPQPRASSGGRRRRRRDRGTCRVGTRGRPSSRATRGGTGARRRSTPSSRRRRGARASRRRTGRSLAGPCEHALLAPRHVVAVGGERQGADDPAEPRWASRRSAGRRSAAPGPTPPAGPSARPPVQPHGRVSRPRTSGRDPSHTDGRGGPTDSPRRVPDASAEAVAGVAVGVLAEGVGAGRLDAEHLGPAAAVRRRRRRRRSATRRRTCPPTPRPARSAPASSVTGVAVPSTATSRPACSVLAPVLISTAGLAAMLRAFCSSPPVQKCSAPSA